MPTTIKCPPFSCEQRVKAKRCRLKNGTMYCIASCIKAARAGSSILGICGRTMRALVLKVYNSYLCYGILKGHCIMQVISKARKLINIDLLNLNYASEV